MNQVDTRKKTDENLKKKKYEVGVIYFGGLTLDIGLDFLAPLDQRWAKMQAHSQPERLRGGGGDGKIFKGGYK